VRRGPLRVATALSGKLQPVPRLHELMKRARRFLLLTFFACTPSTTAPGPRVAPDASNEDGPRNPPAGPDAASAPADAPAGMHEAGVLAPGAPVPLPLVVTEQFPDVGWFGDPAVMAQFQPGSMIIRQGAGSAGPCAARRPGARGRCLEIRYTPPPGLQPGPGGGWVGVYFLRALASPHPQAMPPAHAGEPNWGLEPGLPVAAGATRISFLAAAEASVGVTFRAGTDHDDFVLPEQSELLVTGWTAHALPLAGATYSSGVLGAFAWVLKDTTRPATFYLDDLVWEGGATTTPMAPAGKRDGVRQWTVINKCTQTVWVGIYGQPLPEGGGFRLDAGQGRTITLPSGKWTGRLWGRTGCAVDGAAARCETGDCGQQLMCGGATGKTPATLAEFTLGDGASPDFYDLSLVDGYNLPMAIAPLEGSYTRSPGTAHDCLSPACTHDLNTTCPPDLRLTSAGGQVVGCLSACERFKTDELCCAGAHNQPATCPPSSYSRAFKDACPTAYSYAYDDATSTFTCKGEDYAIWFCP
jgi:hypothetical protein